jgi:hypothetical protein
MTVCPQCAARFSAAPQSERQWLDRHMSRSHGIQRMQLVADRRLNAGFENAAA